MNGIEILLSNKALIIYFTSQIWALPLVNLFVVIGYYSYLISFLQNSQKISPILKIMNIGEKLSKQVFPTC